MFRQTRQLTKESGIYQLENISGELENTINDAENLTMELALAAREYQDALTGEICYTVSVMLGDGETVLGVDYSMESIQSHIYPQHIFILSFSFIPHNYCENTLKAEDNYYLIPQILANSSSSSSHSAVSDTSTLLFSMASFSISIDGDAYIRVV